MLRRDPSPRPEYMPDRPVLPVLPVRHVHGHVHGLQCDRVGLPRRSDGGEHSGDGVERAGHQTVIRPGSALGAREVPSIDEHLQVV